MSGEKVSGEKVAGEKVSGEKVSGEKVSGEKVSGEKVPEKNRTRDLPALSPIDRDGNRSQGAASEQVGQALELKGSNSTKDHARNFLDCVKSRGETNCPIETGHRSSTATLLANVAYDVGRTIEWDAEKEMVRGDADANKHLTKVYRAPWKQVGGQS